MERKRDDDKSGDRVVLASHRRRMWWTQIVIVLLGVASCVAQIIMAAVSCSFRYDVQIVALLRAKPPVHGQTPLIAIVDSGHLDATYAFAIANGAMALGSLFSLFFITEEIELLERGVMPFVWASLFFSNIPLFLGVDLIGGVTVWTELLGLATITSLWLGVMLLGTWINSYAHIDALRDAGWSWSFIVISVLAYAAYNTWLYVSVGTYYRNGGDGALLAPPITLTVLYSFIVVPLLRYYATRTRQSAWSTVLWIYIINAVCVLAVSWVSVIIFGTLDRPAHTHDEC